MYDHNIKTNGFRYSQCLLDLKLFAQLHNDDRLKGTPLEGNNFAKTAIYAKQLLEYIKNNTKGFLDFKDISQVTEDLNVLSLFALKYDFVINKYKIQYYNHNSFSKLEQEIDNSIMDIAEEIIKILNDTKKVLIPGGWSGTFGHAMCYKFIKKSDGSYLFLIYNTGAGIYYHKTKETTKIEYLPVSIFMIPGSCTEEALKIFIQQLIIPLVKPSMRCIKENPTKKLEHTYDEDKLYTKIINKIIYLNGIPIDPEYYYQDYTKGQISGTCAVSVLIPLIRSIFKLEEQQQFEILFHEMKAQTIYDFYYICNLNNCLHTSENNFQLMMAVEKFAYDTNLLWEKNYINEEQRNKYLNLINEVNSCLKVQEEALTVVMEKFLPLGEDFLANNITSKQENFILTKESLELVKDITCNKKTINYEQPFLVKGNIAYVPDRHQYVNIIDYLSNYIAVCMFNEKNKNIHLVLNDIENLFLSFPLEENDFKRYFLNLNTSADIQNCLSKIYILMQIYGKNWVLQGGHTLPKQIIIGYIAAIIGNHLGKLYFKDLIEEYYPFHMHKIYNDNNMSVNLLSYNLLVNINYIYNQESSLITSDFNVQHDPVDTTLNPLYDNKINEINAALNLIKQNLIIAKEKYYNINDCYEVNLIIKKYNLLQVLYEITEDEKNEDLLDIARITLYKLSQQKIQLPYNLSEELKNKIQSLLMDFGVYLQMQNFQSDVYFFIYGNFSYLKSTQSITDKLKYVKTNDKDKRKIFTGNLSSFKFFGCDVEKLVPKAQIFRLEIKNNLIKSTLSIKFDNSNHALIKTNHALNHSIPFTRLSSTTGRIEATLEYFEVNKDTLSNPDYQKLCLFNLMTPRLLHEALDRNFEIADKIVDLVEDLINYHSEGEKLHEGAKFAFKLTCYLINYFRSSVHIFKIQSSVNRLIDFKNLLAFYLPNNPELHDIYIVMLANEYLQSDQNLSIDKIYKFIIAVAKRNELGIRNRSKDLFFKSEVQKILAKMQHLIVDSFFNLNIEQQREFINQIIRALAPELVLQNYTLENLLNFPILKLREPILMEFDLINGIKYVGNRCNGIIPDKFYSKDFIDNFGYCTTYGEYYKLGDNEICEFSKNDKIYRCIIDSNNIYHIQFQFKNCLDEKWFELQDKSKIHFSNQALPRHFLDLNKKWWMNQEKEFIVTTGDTDQVLYEIKNNVLTIIEQEKFILYRLRQNPFINFESSEFIECWKSNNSNKIFIYLPRYDLKFELKNNSNQFRCVNPRFKNYILSLKNSVIEGFSNTLTLQNLDNDNEKLVLIPRQEFYIKEAGIEPNIIPMLEPAGGYYKLTFDINHSIKSKVSNSKDWDITFASQEKFYCYKLIENQISSDNVRACLMLAYVYLATHQAEKAFEQILKCEILGGIKGNIEEIDLILKILQGAPSVAFNEDTNKCSKTFEPETLVVRLHTLSLITRYKEMNYNKLYLSRNKVQFNNKEKEDLQRFFDIGYKEFCTSIYNDYIKVQIVVPINMKLTEQKEFSILDPLFKGVNINQIKGVLQVRWYQLKLIFLNEEKSKIFGVDLKNLQIRKNMIEKLLARENIYHVINSNLDEISLSLKPVKIDFESVEIKTSYFKSSDDWVWSNTNRVQLKSPILMLLCAKKPFGGFDWQDEFPVDKIRIADGLDLRVKEIDLIYSFKELYELALSKMETLEKSKLINFLQQAIQYYEGMKITSKEISNLVLDLSKLLLIVSKNPDKNWPVFLNDASLSPDSILDQLKMFFAQIVNIANDCDEITITYQGWNKEIKPFKFTLPTYPLFPDLQINSSKEKMLEPSDLSESSYFVSGLIQELNLSELYDLYKKLNTFKMNDAENRVDDRMIEMLPAIQVEKFFEKEAKKLQLDLKKGIEKNIFLEMQREIFYEQLKSIELRNNIKQVLLTNDLELNQVIENLKQEILSIANYKFNNSFEGKLLVTSKQKKILGIPDLVALYLQDNTQGKSLFKGKTLLEDDYTIKKLIFKIKDYLIKSRKQQKIKRCLSKLEELETTENNLEKFKVILSELGEELIAIPNKMVDSRPELLVFEYTTGTSLREEQIKYILEPNNRVIQLIMGGGKSKFIIPNLALTRANGVNLVIIEFPAATFETNLSDLRDTMQTAFGMFINEFRFNRETNLSPSNLESMINRWRQIINNREFLVTTPESIQALELKYLELLHDLRLDSFISISKESEQVVLYLEELLKILKSQGDVIIDEIDLNLSSKKELNFTIGENQSVPYEYLKLILDYYNFFKIIKFTEIKGCSLEYLMQNNQFIKDDKAWQIIANTLTKELIINPLSPIYMDIQEIIKQETDDEQIQNFLLGKATSIPECIQNAPYNIQNKIYLLKGEVEISGITLRKNINEHYGFSNLPNNCGNTEIAIPYLASNTPNYKCEFGNVYETINYTIQLYKQLDGKIKLDTLKEFLTTFKIIAKDELLKNLNKKHAIEQQVISLQDTVSYIEFKDLTGMQLDELDPENTTDIKKLQNLTLEQIDNQKVKDYILLHYILPKIKSNVRILRSDPVNHISQFRSAIGMTGTPINYRCYHSSLKFNAEENLGVDGQTIDQLHPTSKSHGTKVRISKDKFDFENLFGGTLNQLNIRAIIDLGAWYKGVDNIIVAQKLYEFLVNQNNNPKIKQILFYNNENILCALQQDLDGMKILEIGSSQENNIYAKTKCKPDECFTYYDQRHTTGVDLKQMSNAIGLATFDKDTTSRDFKQGVKRMRELGRTHSIEVIIPQEVREAFPEIKIDDWNIEKVIQITERNQLKNLAEMHYQSALQKMHNVIRENILDKIYATENIEHKKDLQKLFESVLIKTNELEPLFIFGNLDKFGVPSIVLNIHKDYYLNKWEMLLANPILEEKYKINIFPEEKERIIKYLDEIVKEAVECCYNQISYIPVEEGRAVFVETQKELEQEKYKELEQEAYWPKRDLSPEYNQNVLFKYNIDCPLLIDKNFIKNNMCTLNEMILTSKMQLNWHFDEKIYVTKNFMYTYEGQEDRMDGYQKPAQFIYIEEFQEKTKFFKFKKSTNQLMALIITQEELSYYCELVLKRQANLEKSFKYKAWVISLGGKVLAGYSNYIYNPEMHKLLEQFRFFNGDLEQILHGCYNPVWLSEKMEDKLSYLDRVVFPCYPGKKQKMQSAIAYFNDFNQITASFKGLIESIQDSNKTEFELLHQISEKYKITFKEETFLNFALRYLDKECVAIAISKHANFNQYENLMQTPLELALLRSDNDIVELVMNHSHFYPPKFSEVKIWSVLVDYAVNKSDFAFIKKIISAINGMPFANRERLRKDRNFIIATNLTIVLNQRNNELIKFCLEQYQEFFYPPITREYASVWFSLMLKAVQINSQYVVDKLFDFIIKFNKFIFLNNKFDPANLLYASLKQNEINQNILHKLITSLDMIVSEIEERQRILMKILHEIHLEVNIVNRYNDQYYNYTNSIFANRAFKVLLQAIKLLKDPYLDEQLIKYGFSDNKQSLTCIRKKPNLNFLFSRNKNYLKLENNNDTDRLSEVRSNINSDLKVGRKFVPACIVM